MDAKMSTDEVVAETDKAFKRGGRQGWNEGYRAALQTYAGLILSHRWSVEVPPNPYETPKEESL